MSPKAGKPFEMPLAEARRLWIGAQRLDAPEPFGSGPAATRAAVEQLGYVQIDTINVIERSHHHILWTRIPQYRRTDLHAAQSVEKSVFEYWTHALSYVPTSAYRFFLPEMKAHRVSPRSWYRATPAEVNRVVARVRRDGALSIRDIDDDELVDKDHPWASRKPSKRALQVAFFDGRLTISARAGMVKTYELTGRHFSWSKAPRPATGAQVLDYLLDRALRAQAIVGLDGIAQLDAARKAAMRGVIEARVRRKRLVPVALAGDEKKRYWASPETMAASGEPLGEVVHVLSPFDPLVIQRARLARLFGYEHRFEAYVPKEKRVRGYFALPILLGDRIVAAIDIKADRSARALLIQQWSWVGDGPRPGEKARIEEALGRFEAFQFGA